MALIVARRSLAAPAAGRRERGSAAAEFAVALPAVVLVLLVVLGLGMHGAARVAVEDAARAGARELARAAPAGTVVEQARKTAGPGAAVAVAHEAPYAVVTVTRPVEVFGVVPLHSEHRAEAAVRVEHLPAP